MNGLEVGAALTGFAAFVTAAAGAYATIRQANRAIHHDELLAARIRRMLEAEEEEGKR